MLRNSLFILFWIMTSTLITLIVVPVMAVLFMARISGRFIKKRFSHVG